MTRAHDVMREKGVIQTKFAESFGVAKSSVSQWCSNTVQPPLSKLHEIADAIGCDIRGLITPNKPSVNVKKST